MAYRVQILLLWIGVFIAVDQFAGHGMIVTAVVDQIDSWNTMMRYQVSGLLSGA